MFINLLHIALNEKCERPGVECPAMAQTGFIFEKRLDGQTNRDGEIRTLMCYFLNIFILKTLMISLIGSMV